MTISDSTIDQLHSGVCRLIRELGDGKLAGLEYASIAGARDGGQSKIETLEKILCLFTDTMDKQRTLEKESK